MTEDQLRAIETRVDAATPGPWIGTTDPSHFDADCVDSSEWSMYVERRCDRDFIAHARADIPALVAEVRRLQRENAVYEAAVALAETCELGCGDYGGNIFDDELLFKYREARLNGESEDA